MPQLNTASTQPNPPARWRVLEAKFTRGFYYKILGSDRRMVAEMFDKKTATRIVRAVNAHDELVAALERIVAIKASSGGPKSLVDEFKFIASSTLANIERK